jgi:hypothetical protein
MYLLMDNSKHTNEALFRPYKERYMLFETYEECRAVANKRGFDDSWGMFGDRIPAVGTMQEVSSGDIQVAIMAIEMS